MANESKKKTKKLRKTNFPSKRSRKMLKESSEKKLQKTEIGWEGTERRKGTQNNTQKTMQKKFPKNLLKNRKEKRKSRKRKQQINNISSKINTEKNTIKWSRKLPKGIPRKILIESFEEDSVSKRGKNAKRKCKE